MVVSEFRRDQGIDLSRDPMAMQRLKEAAEGQMRTVERRGNGTKSAVYHGRCQWSQTSPHEAQSLKVRANDRRSCRAQYWSVQASAQDSGLSPSNIDEVVLVGGSAGIATRAGSSPAFVWERAQQERQSR